MVEFPQYTIKPNVKRLVVPRILLLVLLGILFYFLIFMNVTFLGMEMPIYITLLIVAVIIVGIIIQVIMYHVKFQKVKFVFYTNRIEYQDKKPRIVLFKYVTSVKIKKDFLDKLLGTGTIMIEPNFKLGPIKNVSEIYGYVQKLTDYYRKVQEKGSK